MVWLPAIPTEPIGYSMGDNSGLGPAPGEVHCTYYRKDTIGTTLLSQCVLAGNAVVTCTQVP